MRKRALLAGLLLLTAACDSGGSVSGFAVESYLSVDPSRFGVPCATDADAGNGFASYVVTLVELRQNDEGEPVERRRGTSAPQSCDRTVLFSQSGSGLTFSNPYVADIWGYDTTDLEADEEDPRIIRRDGQQAQPTWVGSCGRLDELDTEPSADAGVDVDADFYERYNGPQYLVSRRTVTLRGCTLEPVGE